MGKTVGARELKARLGTYLRAVRRGATIVVSDRGEPIAELRPLPRSKHEVQQAHLDHLVAIGTLTPPSGKPLRPRRPIRMRGKSISDTIIDDRKDRI